MNLDQNQQSENAVSLLSARIKGEATHQIPIKFRDKGLMAKMTEDWTFADAMVEGWKEKIARVMRDTRLSNEGRRLELVKVANAATEDVRPLRDRHDKQLQAMANLQNLLRDYRKRPKDANELLTYLREKEVRDGLWDENQQARDAAFLKACERMDAEAMRALTLDVPGGPWVTGEILARGEEAYGQAHAPEAVANLKMLELYEERLRGVIEHIAKTLLTMGADPAKITAALGIDSEEPAHA